MRDEGSEGDVKSQPKLEKSSPKSSKSRAYYLKKSEMKVLQLIEKYEVLKSKGAVDKFLAKKRKRRATRGRKYVPSVPKR
ncbi:Conserved protein of unknown function [Ostreococcus lucimarinus CCE9901]|uniref:rRNA biogenesis protein RRP36 n=1 Tax=Ostreococcus lucimarinus (strain CCE9901) TaxID=436017 RepID=A4RT01_OSTLU|nr:[Ostreococcus lucimarinus CCE9901] [Ostreococcus lucimarinus CCE9901]ABO94450.1 Conserved protein of unknown function [Ostreococcus lucimarinus CCE9901]|eukprot:XP_001416157.1 [Ostreococcus lucimarinus CCE9901]